MDVIIGEKTVTEDSSSSAPQKSNFDSCMMSSDSMKTDYQVLVVVTRFARISSNGWIMSGAVTIYQGLMANWSQNEPEPNVLKSQSPIG